MGKVYKMKKNNYCNDAFLISYLGKQFGQCTTQGVNCDLVVFGANDDFIYVHENKIEIVEHLIEENNLYKVIGFCAFHKYNFVV